MSEAPKTVRLDKLAIPPGSGWSRLPLVGVALGILGVGASLALRGEDPEQFAFSWLVAFLYCLSIALGALFFVLVHHATKAGWGVAVRRLAENLMATLPLFALLALPVMFGVHELFHWSHEDALAHDKLLQSKQGYLNTGFFYARAALYFVCCTALGLWFWSSSRKQDVSGDESLTRRMIWVSGPAIMIFAVTVTFAAFDWIMSLEPHWYSTIFGVYYFAGCLVGAFAMIVLLTAGLVRAGHLADVINTEHFHDLGKLLFAFTVFWAYIGFSQYFLIWYGNIPEETAWFLRRMEGSWQEISILLAAGHFIVPFFFLMSRHIKRRTPLLITGALWMLFMHLVDVHWLVMPTLHKYDPHLTVLDVTTLVGVGGWFLAAVTWIMRRQALVPLRDPRLSESLSFENI
jgi:hypothetical protein